MAPRPSANMPLRSFANRKAMDQFAKPRQPSAQIQHELAQERKAADAAYALANPPPPKTRKPRK